MNELLKLITKIEDRNLAEAIKQECFKLKDQRSEAVKLLQNEQESNIVFMNHINKLIQAIVEQDKKLAEINRQ